MSRMSVASTAMAAAVLVGVVSAEPAGKGRQKARPSNAEAVCGTWVLQQVGGQQDLKRLLPRVIAPALATPEVRGFSMRVPWKAIAKDFSLLEAGRKIAAGRGLAFSVRFMAGRHTPAAVFDRGCRFYLRRGEKVPVPFLADGSPNVVFEKAYATFVGRLAAWCRQNGVRLLHLAWYGQDWAELNHGREVRGLAGYSYANWLRAHQRLIDIGLKHADETLAVELPFSGYGPLTDAAVALADHVVGRIGPSKAIFFCQANGWGRAGEWGAPAARTERQFDRVWARPVCRGLQAIQPRAFDWAEMFRKVYACRATYCEVYAPSFTLKGADALAREVARFAHHCRKAPPRPGRGR